MSARIIDTKRLAEHLGYVDDSSAMHDWVRNTLGVKPVPGRRGMYDIKAVDAALDRLSRLTEPTPEVSAYDQWKRDNAA